jgi:hypothetical protein
MSVIKKKIVCRDCEGYGVYQGECQRDRAAVVCSRCNGSGCEDLEFEYELFVHRKVNYKRFKRVFKASFGYVHSDKDVDFKDDDGVIRTIKFSEAGVSYRDWLMGKEPIPVESLYCPCVFEGQDLRNKSHKAHALYTEKCIKYMPMFRTSCSHNIDEEKRKKCWERYYELMKKG